MAAGMTGAEDYVATLAKLRVKTSGPAMDKALLAGGRVLRAAEQERAPLLDKRTQNSTALPPGALKAGIRVYRRPDAVPSQVVIGPKKKIAHVAAFVELGHQQIAGRGKDGRVIAKDVPAHPFLRPAFESSRSEVSAAIVESIKSSLAEGGADV